MFSCRGVERKLLVKPYSAFLIYAPVGLVVAALAACGDDAPAAPSVPPGDDAGQDPPDGSADAPTERPVEVMTHHGPVVGRSRDGISAFLGIPYAAPPVGARRWRPPVEPDSWTTPRDASQFGLACPQGRSVLGGPKEYSEDCLTLNVWSPNRSSEGPLPIMVFIHGGAFRGGSSNEPLYDGRNLAARGFVVVTINYRLGQLGFLAHPALSAEDEHQVSGNYGLLDQQAALRWVQTNAAAFGGAADTVTVFGESAGSMSACSHLASPFAKGLFRRAIAQSGACNFITTPLHDEPGSTTRSAEAPGRNFAQVLGCDTAPDVLACLRGKTAAEAIAVPPPASETSLEIIAYGPNVDGYVLPEAPWAAFRAGRINPVSGFITGLNRDEATLFTINRTIDTPAEFEAAVRAIVPEHVEEVLTMYPAPSAAHATLKDAYDAFITDTTFACPTRAQARILTAQGVPTYLYLFDRMGPRKGALDLGVHHGSELPFVFGNFTAASGATDADRAFSDTLIGYWTRFATSGDPGGTPAWPPLSSSNDVYLELGEPLQTATGLRASTCDVIDSWYGGE